MKKTEKENNDSFIRWQGRTIEELGKAINLLLSLCLVTIGFIFSKLIDKDFQFHNCNSKLLVIIGSFILLLSIVITLFLIYNRLFSFRLTTKIARLREKNDLSNINIIREEVKKRDKWTWALFSFCISTFLLGEAIVIFGFIIEILKR